MEGKEIIIDTRESERHPGPGVPRGVLFNIFDGQECPPLSGRVLLRVLQCRAKYAYGIGVATAGIDLNKDPEYDQNFFGFYHGGGSVNIAAGGRRVFNGSHYHLGGRWPEASEAGALLAVLVDTDAGTMQCYTGLKQFGDPVQLPDAPLWPVFVGLVGGDQIFMNACSV